MRKLSKDIILILITIFLLRMPPLYFLPVQNTIFTTHSIGILLLLLVTIRNTVFIHHKNGYMIFSCLEAMLILLFFISQSISVLYAVSTVSFIQRLVKIIIGIVIYFNLKLLIKKENEKSITDTFLYLFMIGSVITFLIQMVILFLPHIYLDYFNNSIYSGVYSITKANLIANKIFDDTYFELIIPIVMYFLSQRYHSRIWKTILTIYLLSIGFVTFASNFRYRLLTYLVSILFSFEIVKKISMIKIAFIAVIILFTISIVDPIMKQTTKLTFIDRLIDSEEYADTSSISWMISMFKEAVELANSHIFGAGLGNMFDYIKKPVISSGNNTSTRSIAALTSGPHNIFFQYLGETGYVGLFAFIVLLLYWAKKDLLILKNNNEQAKALIICFWSLIFSVQFFPAINLTFYSMFFMLRALI